MQAHIQINLRHNLLLNENAIEYKMVNEKA